MTSQEIVSRFVENLYQQHPRAAEVISLMYKAIDDMGCILVARLQQDERQIEEFGEVKTHQDINYLIGKLEMVLLEVCDRIRY